MRALGRLPRHAGPLLARGRAGGDLRRRRRARRRRPPTRSTTSSPRGSAEDAYRPRALFERFRHRGPGHHRRPVRRPRRARRAGRRPDLVRPGDPDLPARPLPRAGAARLAGRGRRGSARSSGVDTGDYAGFVAAHGGAAAALRRARRDVGRPQPRGRPHRPARARRGRPHLPRGAGRARPPPPRRWRFRRHMLLRDGADVLRGRPGDDAAPGRAPQPPRADARQRFGPDTGHDIPLRVEFTDALRPLLERFGTHPDFHLVAVHARRDGVLARARAAGRLLPVGLRRRAVVVPRRARGDPALPRARSPRPPASRAPRASSTTPARSARSRPATTCRAASTPASWPQLVAEHRLDEDEAVETAVDLVDRAPDGGVQAVSAPRCRARGRGRRGAGAARAPRARQLLPRPPGLVHRPRRTRRTGASPRSPGAAPRSPTRSAPRTGSTRWSRAPATATAST